MAGTDNLGTVYSVRRDIGGGVASPQPHPRFRVKANAAIDAFNRDSSRNLPRMLAVCARTVRSVMNKDSAISMFVGPSAISRKTSSSLSVSSGMRSMDRTQSGALDPESPRPVGVSRAVEPTGKAEVVGVDKGKAGRLSMSPIMGYLQSRPEALTPGTKPWNPT